MVEHRPFDWNPRRNGNAQADFTKVWTLQHLSEATWVHLSFSGTSQFHIGNIWVRDGWTSIQEGRPMHREHSVFTSLRTHSFTSTLLYPRTPLSPPKPRWNRNTESNSKIIYTLQHLSRSHLSSPFFSPRYSNFTQEHFGREMIEHRPFDYNPKRNGNAQAKEFVQLIVLHSPFCDPEALLPTKTTTEWKCTS